jgi:hypothetical protein
MKKSKKPLFWLAGAVAAVLVFILVILPLISGDKTQDVLINDNGSVSEDYGNLAYDYIVYLSKEIGSRPAGTSFEKEAAEYIYSEFKAMGYKVNKQSFIFKDYDGERESQNIIAAHPANSADKKGTLIIGGHYDSVDTAGTGAHDNASAVGVLLEVAERSSELALEYNLIFIALGAEEPGLFGSFFYVSQMSDEEIDSTFAMINLDSLIAGDYLYVHGSEGEEGWLRDKIISRAKALELNIRMQPGLNPDYPAGVAYPASDHVPFEELNIPYAYYESTNWEEDQLDEDMTGYVETVDEGEIWHTEKDNLDFIEKAFPGRIEERLRDTVRSLMDILPRLP